MPNVDSLNISISATAQKANSSLDVLIGKLDKLSSSLIRINTGNLNNMSNGFERLGRAMTTMSSSNIKATEINKLANGINKLSSLNVSNIQGAANAINTFTGSVKSLSTMSVDSGLTQITDLANAIKQLGYKSSTQAISNIPLLGSAMEQLITTLSKLPKVSQNLIDMTNALAKLARTGSSSGKAATSLSASLKSFSTVAKTAKTRSLSLASAIGTLYAKFWLLFRAFKLLKNAMDLSSDLTEVQNVVNATFGSYSSVLEKFADTAISSYGISELSAKKTASTFQAMGTAMGFSQGKMADMSVELTKLSADMASFYNVSQEDVAEDLNAVFTGMTRPLRQYGLDLTEATLKEWALKNGMDANIDSMSQAQKTMLRYQYVMANTKVAQGDFAKTQMTWANQTKILVENFKALGTVIGGPLTNALKPFVIALNEVMAALIAFSETVSNSLGKIFGWQYESGSSGLATEYEDASDYASDMADSASSTAKSVDDIKKGLRAFDELKTISIESSSGSGGAGSGSGSTGTTSASASGTWTRTESLFEEYESALDNLYKLGDYIGNTLTNTLNNIDWNDVYEGARNFGTGLADFLNGLISPELFYSVGRTIANSLNTVIQASLSFADSINFASLGKSIGSSINGFFLNFNFKDLAESINYWVDGIETLIIEAVKEIDFIKILGNIFSGIGSLDIDTSLILGALAAPALISGITKLTTKVSGLVTFVTRLKGAFGGLLEKIGPVIGKVAKFLAGLSPVTVAIGALVSAIAIALVTSDDFREAVMNLWKNAIVPLGNAIADTLSPVFQALEAVLSGLWNSVLKPVATFISSTFTTAINAVATILNKIVNPAITGISTAFSFLLTTVMKPLVSWLSGTFTSVVGSVFTSVQSLVGNITTVFKGLITFVKGVFVADWKTAWNGIKTAFSGVMSSLKTIARTPINALMAMFEGLANGVIKAWNSVKKAINSLSLTIPSWVPSVGGKTIGFNLGMTSTISLPRFATGGFPEDGTFRASHGEIMGRFDNGKSVVANNKQITEGISAAVYQGNRENNALLRQEIQLMQAQNDLLARILEKETGISAREVFESVRKSAYEYNRRTGNPAFV